MKQTAEHPGWPAATAWILLDWAASAFSTILITLIVAYVEKIVFVDRAWGVPGGVVWAWLMATTMILSAVLSPWLAAWADRSHRHQQALLASVVVGGGGCLLLAAVPPDTRIIVASGIVVAGIGFDLVQVFTGSLLPRLAGGPAADRLSAAGFAAGYAGGACALLVATGVVAARESLGLSAPGALRCGAAIAGGWWIIFSLPAAWVRMGDGRTQEHEATSTAEIIRFARSLVGTSVGRVLAGAVLILGAVQTAISQFSSLAIEEFHMDSSALVRLVLLVQAVALPGALAMGWLSALWSRGGVLALCLAGWAAVLVLAWRVTTPSQLTAVAVLLALVLGGIQSVLRATVAEVAPRGSYGATFGLLQVGTKLTGFFASLVFGGIYALTGHPRSGLLAILAQLAVGWFVLGRRTPFNPTIPEVSASPEHEHGRLHVQPPPHNRPGESP
jgi:UMF1 family MFS transporter